MAKIDFTRERTYGKSFDGILKLQGHVASEANLPLSAESGDIYSVGEDNVLYMFNGEWKEMSGGGAPTPIVVHGTMIVRGSGNPSEFTPDDGQPTFSEAVEAFESGVPVMLVAAIEEGAGTVSANIVSYGTIGDIALLMAISEALIIWANVNSPDPDPDPEPEPEPDPEPDPEPEPDPNVQ